MYYDRVDRERLQGSGVKASTGAGARASPGLRAGDKGYAQLTDPMREWFYPSKRRQTVGASGLGPGSGQGRQQGRTVSNGSGSGSGSGNKSISSSSSFSPSTAAAAAGGLNPPFHVDTHLALKRMLKAASQGRLSPATTTATAAAKGTGTGAGASSSSSSGSRNVNTRWVGMMAPHYLIIRSPH